MAAAGLEWKDLYPKRPEYAAAVMQKRKLPPVDELDIDRLVIQMARNALARGEVLSFEDEARAKLALERIRGEYV
jgi:hypothetical protein